MRTLIFAATVITMIAAGPAYAIQDKKPDEATKSEKRICRSVQVTGSIMGKRECHTAAEWKQQDEINAANVDQFRNHGSAGGNTRNN